MAKRKVYQIKGHAPGMIHVPTVGDINTENISPAQLAQLTSLGVPLQEVEIEVK